MFAVNGGAGLRVGAVFVSFNGPLAARCQIPVFAVPSDTPTDPDQPTNPGFCNTVFNSTPTTVTAAWPQPVWNALTVQSFFNNAVWSAPLTVPVDQRDVFVHSTTPGTCASYIAVRYNRAQCGADIDADAGQTVFMGETRAGTQVQRLFALRSIANQWNVCLPLNPPGVRFFESR
jgi:hypothetical protein